MFNKYKPLVAAVDFYGSKPEAELYQAEGYDRSGFVSTDDPVSTLCVSRGFTSFRLVAWTETC